MRTGWMDERKRSGSWLLCMGLLVASFLGRIPGDASSPGILIADPVRGPSAPLPLEVEDVQYLNT